MRQRDSRGKPVPFSCAVCKLNYTTGTGGERLYISKAVYYRQKHIAKPRLTDKNKAPKSRGKTGTINLLLIPSNEIRTVHVRLIEKFNGMTVYD